MDDVAMQFFMVAFEEFVTADARSIVGNAHEQNLCGKLGMRLDSHRPEFGLANYIVDPEYDRMLFDVVKKIFRNGSLQAIRSDLVVHIPGKNDNLIALEMKKVDRSSAGLERRENDRQRLMAMTTPSDVGGHPEHVSGYELGVFVELDPARRTYVLEEFRSGHSVGERHGGF